VIALDIGTVFIVKSEMENEKPSFTRERNCFLQVATGEDTEATLQENSWAYIKHENQYYVLGEDAIKLKNLLTIGGGDKNKDIVMTNVGELRRPMKDGLLNTAEEKLSVAIIQTMLKNLVGKPAYEGEPLCFCVPSDPVNSNMKVIFHKTMLSNFLKSLGYAVESIPEALAIIYSERPVMEDPDEGEVPFSGLALSCGGGMLNCIFSYKKMPLISFSIQNSGDWIDIETAKVAGKDVSAVTRYKESQFDLTKVDYSNMVEAGLDIFYGNMIENGLNIFAERFNQLEVPIEASVPVVVSGGTASVPGFLEKFKSVLEGLDLPFKIKSITLAENPLYTVANGCLVKAISMDNKLKKEEKPKAKKSKLSDL